MPADKYLAREFIANFCAVRNIVYASTVDHLDKTLLLVIVSKWATPLHRKRL